MYTNINQIAMNAMLIQENLELKNYNNALQTEAKELRKYLNEVQIREKNHIEQLTKQNAKLRLRLNMAITRNGLLRAENAWLKEDNSNRLNESEVNNRELSGRNAVLKNERKAQKRPIIELEESQESLRQVRQKLEQKLDCKLIPTHSGGKLVLN